MAEVNSTDHLVRSEKDTLANGYDNEGYHPPTEDGEEDPSNDHERLRPGATDPVPNGHAHEDTNGHVNGTAVIVLQEEEGEDEDTSTMDEHNSSQQKPLDTRLHHYIPVEDIDRKILNGSDVSIPEDAVISFSTGRVKVKKGGSSSPQSPRGDIPLETLPPSYGDQDETRSEKAGLEAELNKNGVWSSSEGYNYGSAESQFVVSEKLNGTNNKSSSEEVSLPVSNHRKCLRGEKLYFNSDDSRKVCPNWKRLLICGAITIVLSVVILMCVFAATGIIYTKNTKYESGHSLPSVDSIAHAGPSWPRTSSSSKVPQKPQVDASPPNATSAHEELDTVTRAPSTVTLKVPLLNDSSHSQTIVPNALVGEFTIIDENFTYDLNDNTSRGYMVLANNLETELRRIFRENGARFENLKILSFRPGSIKVKFVVIWNSDQGIIRSDRASEILAADLRQKNNSFYNFFAVDINSIHFLDVFDECRIQKGGCSFDCLWNYDTLSKTCICPKNNYLLPDGKSCAPIPETSSTLTTTTTTTTAATVAVPSSSSSSSQGTQTFSSETNPATEPTTMMSPSQSTSSLKPLQEITTTIKPITMLFSTPRENLSSTQKSYRGIFENEEPTTTEIPQSVSTIILPEGMGDLTTTEKYSESDFETEKSAGTAHEVIVETTTASITEYTEDTNVTKFVTHTPNTNFSFDNFTTEMEPITFAPEKNESTFSFEDLTVPTEIPVSITTLESRETDEPVTEFPFGRAQNDSTLKFHIAEPTTELYTFDSRVDYTTELSVEEETTTQSVPTTLSDDEATEKVQESTYPSTSIPVVNGPSTFNPSTYYPSTYNPTAYSPETYKSATYTPSTYNPTAYNPSSYNPSTYNPTAYNPSTYNPTTYNPSTYNPATYNPSTYNPTAYNPSTYNPTSYNPSTYNPTAYNPSTYNPAAYSPSTYNPTYNPSTYNPNSYYPSSYTPTNYNPSTFNPIVYSPSAYNPTVSNPTTYGEEKATEYEAETTTSDAFKTEPDTTLTTSATFLDVKQDSTLTTDQTQHTTFNDNEWKSQNDSLTVSETTDYETTPFYDENLHIQPVTFPNLASNETEVVELNATEEMSLETTTVFFIPFLNRTPEVKSDNFTAVYDNSSNVEEHDYFTTDMTESETHTETVPPNVDIFQPSLNLSSEVVTTSSPTTVQTTSATNVFKEELTTSNLDTTNTSEELKTEENHTVDFLSEKNVTEAELMDKETEGFEREPTSGFMTEFTTLPSITVLPNANFSTETVLDENVTSVDLVSVGETTTTTYNISTVMLESTVPEFTETEILESQFTNTQDRVTSPDYIAAETTMPYTTDIFSTETDAAASEPSSVRSIQNMSTDHSEISFDNADTTTYSYQTDGTTTMSTLEDFETTTETMTTPIPVKPQTENPFHVERNLTYVTAIVDGGDFKKIVNLSIVPVNAGSHNLTRTTMMPIVPKTESTTARVVSPESFGTTNLGSENDTTASTLTKESSSVTNKYETADLTTISNLEPDSNSTITSKENLDGGLETTTTDFNVDTVLTTPFSTDFNTQSESTKEKPIGTTIIESEITTTASEFANVTNTFISENASATEPGKLLTDEALDSNRNYFTEAIQPTIYTENPFSYKNFENGTSSEVNETTVGFNVSPITPGISFNFETKDMNASETVEEATTPVSATDLNPDETEVPNESEVTTVAPYITDNSTAYTTVDAELDFNMTSSMNKSEEDGTSEFSSFSPENFNGTDGNYTFEDENGNYTTTGFDGLINETTTNATTGIVCREDQFICGPLNICLNNTFMCDGIQDCPDGVDEFNCQDSCGLNFRCSNTSNMCIMADAHCDGIWDCENGTDEESCSPIECAKHEVMCLDHSKCIRPSDICDNKYDCKDRSDEVGCVERTTCESGGRFFCNDGLCIPWSLKCDGEFDCKDKEDESNCTCISDEFQCNDGKCIKSSSRCDGHRDCHDGGDEMGCVNVDSQHIVTTYEPYSGTWALLCAEDFNLDDGHYLCQELGFGHALKTDKIHVSFNGTWMAMRRDNLTDSSLWTERVAFVESCTSSLAASVECQKFGCGDYPGLLHRRRKRDILGGSSSSSQWPFIGYTSTFSSNRGCLSEILTPIWLITSADCLLSISRQPFNGSDWYVRTNIGRDVEVGMAQNHEVLRIINHSHSSKFRSLVLRDYDVALIRLKHALVFVPDRIGAICPPEEQVPPGITCFSGVLGTQKPRAPPPTTLTINSLALQILDRKNCNSVEHYNNQINQRMLCTQSSEGHTICDNDEGTPLMCLTGINKWFLAGMLTYQRYCEVYSKHPAVFSNLFTMRKFIDQVTGQKQYEISYDSNMYVIVPPTTPSPTVPETTTLFTTTETTLTTEMGSSTYTGTETGFETTGYTESFTNTTESDTYPTELMDGSFTETTGAEILNEELRGEENYTTVQSRDSTTFEKTSEITTVSPVEGIELKEPLTVADFEKNLTTLSPFAFKVYEDRLTTPSLAMLDEVITTKDQMEFESSNTSSTEPQEFGQVFNVSEMANKTHGAMMDIQPNDTFSEYSSTVAESYQFENETKMSNESIPTTIEEVTNGTEALSRDLLATTIVPLDENSTTTGIPETTLLSVNRMPVMSFTNETAFKAPERLTLTTLTPVSEGETLIAEAETETQATTVSDISETTLGVQEITETSTQSSESSTLILKSARLEAEPIVHTEIPLFITSTEGKISDSTMEKPIAYTDLETMGHTEKPTEIDNTETPKSTLKLGEYEGFTEAPHFMEETMTPAIETEAITSAIETEAITPAIETEAITPAIETEATTSDFAAETTFNVEKLLSTNETTSSISDLKITTPASETGTLIFETEVETDGDLAIIAFNDSSGIVMEPLESMDDLGNLNNSKDYLPLSRKLDDSLGSPGIVYESPLTDNSDTTINTSPTEEFSTTGSDNLFASLVSAENVNNFTNIMKRLVTENIRNETYSTLLPELSKNDTLFEEEMTTPNPVTQFDNTFVPYINTTDGMQNYSMMETLTEELMPTRKNYEKNTDICGVWEHPVNTSKVNETKFYNEWPALGYLQMISKTDLCAASLISSQFVITSLNCLSIRDNELNPDKWAFVSGLYDQESLKEGQQNHLISKIIPFTNASISVLFHEHNLALVKLKDQVVGSKYSQNVCLPEEVQPGKECYTAGWSRNASGDGEKTFYSVPVDIIPPDQCNSTTNYSGLMLDSLICAIYNNETFPTCQMDYGSPLFCLNENDRWEIQGILNFPNPCDMVQPAVYDRTTSVQDWIMNVLIDDAL